MPDFLPLGADLREHLPLKSVGILGFGSTHKDEKEKGRKQALVMGPHWEAHWKLDGNDGCDIVEDCDFILQAVRREGHLLMRPESISMLKYCSSVRWNLKMGFLSKQKDFLSEYFFHPMKISKTLWYCSALLLFKQYNDLKIFS